MRKTTVAVFLLLVSSDIPAQSGAFRAGEALGEAIFGKPSQSVYDEAYQQTLESEKARWEAIRARQDAEHLARVLRVRGLLVTWWTQLGLPEDEARAVAGAYEWTAEQDAMIIRARRDGFEPTMDAAMAAYQAYRYREASQLLMAAQAIPVGEGQK